MNIKKLSKHINGIAKILFISPDNVIESVSTIMSPYVIKKIKTENKMKKKNEARAINKMIKDAQKDNKNVYVPQIPLVSDSPIRIIEARNLDGYIQAKSMQGYWIDIDSDMVYMQ